MATINAWNRGTHTVPSIQAMDKSFKPGAWRSKDHNGAQDEFRRFHAFICAVEKCAAATSEGAYEDRVAGLEMRFEAHRVALAENTTAVVASSVSWVTGICTAEKTRSLIRSLSRQVSSFGEKVIIRGLLINGSENFCKSLANRF